jgi:DNA-directed RNA polymerase specialized sigma24 family protein
MSMLSFKPAVPDEDPRRREDQPKEKVFLEHYSWLAECAQSITHGQRDQAEDLVHDVFVQFLAKDLDAASITDIRWYLNGILRNLHLLQLRRATRHPVQQLSLLDHDSALVGLRVQSSVEQLQSADLLARACDFVCYRKETSLTASVLILRFFHGYYPGELSLLLRAKRKAVDKWIERGRTEAKQYVESPYPLPDGSGTERRAPSGASPNAFLRRLRERIFDSCTTECSVLTASPDELGVKELAHLVSCRSCLDRRSRKMGLAHVAERMADDISDRDDGRPLGGSGGSGDRWPMRSRREPSKGEILRRAYGRRRELFEHRPKEISLSFDGQPRATLLVNAPTNTLNLSLDRKEVPNSIAIMSEQEFRFLILDHDDLTSSVRRVHRLPLSDQRYLQVVVTPETLGPSIQLVYEDPFLLTGPSDAQEAEPGATKAQNPIPTFPSERADFATAFEPGWRAALRGKLQSLIPAMNPLLTSAIVLGAISVLCFVFWLRSVPSLPAGELLNHAQTSERAAVAANRPGVIYEKVTIRTQKRSLERTIYRDAQGVRRPRRQQLSPEDEQLKNHLASADVNWDAPLSAVDYAEWRHRSGPTRDSVTRSGQHLLTLTTTPIEDSPVLKETITVRDVDFHAVDRTIVLRDSGTIEIAELNYDVLPWGAVNQDWFEPLTGQMATDGPGMLPALHVPHRLTDLELDEAELEVRIALNQLHADSGEQIHMSRAANGIQVKGVVETGQRKQQIVARLLQVPHVHASVVSVDELGSYPRSGSPPDAGQPIHVYSVESEPSPLERYMRESKLSTDQLVLISHSLLDGGLKIQQAAVHLSELQPRIKGANQLPADMQNQLAGLSRTYVNTIEAGLDANKRILVSLGLDHTSQPAGESSAPEGDLDQQVRRYQELSQELITSATGQSRPAEAIAGELANTSTRIRLHLAQQPATIPSADDQ